MKRLKSIRIALLLLTLLWTVAVMAQEVKPTGTDTPTPEAPTAPMSSPEGDTNVPGTESVVVPSRTEWGAPGADRGAMSSLGYDVETSKMSGAFFPLWKNAAVGVYGGMDHMPGLMDLNTGSVVLFQDFGRLHLSLSANANKYWMPMQSTLLTQYGFGGHVSYDAASWLSLHAFGNYYAGDLRLQPAISPYAFTTSYGGYADVRFSNHWGANLGAQRYLNPMNGRWETEPIITPYYKFNNGAKIELPLGHLVKEAIWGRDRPMFGETPVPIMMRPFP